MTLLYDPSPAASADSGERARWPAIRGARTSIRLAGVAASLAVLAYLLDGIDFADLLSVTGALPAATVALALAALVVNLVGSAVRLRVVMADFGFALGWLASARATLFGTLGGLMFLQIVGQTLTRYAVLREAGVSGSATLLVSLYERAVATVVLAALAGAGLFYLFGTLTLDLGGGGLEFLRLALGLVLAVGAGAAIGYASQLRGAFSRMARRTVGLRLLRTLAITLAMQAAMLGAYVLLARGVAPAADVAQLCAAAAIVMFAAALPISFGGWGVREVSAVAAFGAVGIGTAEALTVSVTVGVISQVLVAGGAGLVWLGWAGAGRAGAAVPAPTARAATGTDHFALLATALPIAAATAVFFQLRLPVGDGELNVNLADPIAVAGALACIAGWLGTRSAKQRWRLAPFETVLATLAAVLAAGFLHGALAFGVTDWALFNRVLGTVILIAYALTGALIVSQTGMGGLKVMLRTFVVVAAAITAADYAFYLLQLSGADLGRLQPRMEAMAGNPNAFGFQAVMAAAVWLVMPDLGLGRRRSSVAEIVGGLVLTGIWMSGSRASIGALLIVVVVAGLTVRIDWPRLAKAAAVAIVLVAGLDLLPALVAGLSSPSRLMEDAFGWRSAIYESDAQRWHSIVLGARMWLDHPIFGAGLGAFHQASLTASGVPLVIHSSPVWLLAEFGLFGFAALAGVAAWAGARLVELWRRAPSRPAIAIAGLAVVAMAAEFMVHDMLYQRTFWLVIGACLAAPLARARRT